MERTTRADDLKRVLMVPKVLSIKDSCTHEWLALYMPTLGSHPN